MMDSFDDRGRAAPRDEEREATLAEIVDRFTGKLVTALVLASGILALAIYSRPSPPHYQAVVAPDGRVLRLNTSNGTIISCDGGARCVTIVRPGQHLGRASELPAAKAPPAQLPAPQAPAAPPAGQQPAPEQPRR